MTIDRAPDDSQTNPFASPTAAGGHVTSGEKWEKRCDFGSIIRRWERLRIIYNGILTAIVLLLVTTAFRHLIGGIEFWVYVLFGALLANLCFFTGPAIEGYGTHLGIWHPVLTVFLFLAGLGLATLLTVGYVTTYAGI